MNTLDLSGKIDAKSIAIYAAINKASKDLNIPYVVVGASARDLILHYGYGVRVRLATADIDFGIQLPGWEAFAAIKQKLLKAGFAAGRTAHRLYYLGYQLDLVPFGSIQDENANISWPPDNTIIMNVLGFEEALNNTIKVIIQKEPEITIPVVSLPALSLLKIICWSDRDADLKSKDAKDLLYLLKNYEQIPEIRASIFEIPDMMEKYDWDITLASAFKLGMDASAIASVETKTYLSRIENSEIENRPYDMLIEDMCEDIEEEFEINQSLFNAWFSGFNGE